MDSTGFDIGMAGLGVMGNNFALNLADHGFKVSGFDLDLDKVNAFQPNRPTNEAAGFHDVGGFIASLKKPRVVMMLVPAGPPVDGLIREMLPYLEPEDLIIDGGNSFYKDTNLRGEMLAKKGILFLGVGVSGGEHGARNGASLMPGGDPRGYQRVEPLLTAAAAKVNGEPCSAYLGPSSAGHYVKMVHNGIEYGLMELIAEAYDLMKRGLEIDDEAIQATFAGWDKTELSSYLLEITADIFGYIDPQTNRRLIDEILDEARQKGTGKWASQDAMDLQVPTPTIDIAVSIRDLSGKKEDRKNASMLFPSDNRIIKTDHKAFLNSLRNALFAGMIMTYAQGMALLYQASQEYHYDLDLETIARIWRGGCIIRSDFLEEIRQAFHRYPHSANLLLDPHIGGSLLQGIVPDLRCVIVEGIQAGIPLPGLTVSLAYFDSYRSAWLPANLIQAQRDYFGAHTYERIDQKGQFHTHWERD